MASHPSVLAWKIPWTEEPGRLQSLGSQRVSHGWSDWAGRQAGLITLKSWTREWAQRRHAIYQGSQRWWISSRLSSVQLLSHVQLFATLWTAACQASLSITNSWSLLKLMTMWQDYCRSYSNTGKKVCFHGREELSVCFHHQVYSIPFTCTRMLNCPFCFNGCSTWVPKSSLPI